MRDIKNDYPKTITERELKSFCKAHRIEYNRFCKKALRPDTCGIGNCRCPNMGGKTVCAQHHIAHNDHLLIDWHIRFIRRN